MNTPKGQLPGTKISLKKGWRKVLLENQEEFAKKLNRHKGEMKQEIAKEVERRLDDYVKRVDGALTEVILQKKILFDKGFITPEELTEKYKELMEKKNG